jgi:CHAT domain-containing protein
VASGRDLLRKLQPSPELRMAIYANPDFVVQSEIRKENSPQAKSDEQRAALKRDLEELELPPLPGTAEESQALEAQAKNAGWQTEIHRGKEATELELRRMRSPRILHLATHGFFLPMHTGEAPENEGQRGIAGMRPSVETGATSVGGSAKGAPTHVVLENPMLRSGLALAGAQTTLRAWSRGEVPPTEDDGIINALEVGGLDLKNTWLVTLSACDTGSGTAAAGEGVMGLRRGFIEAGAQNLLMTLWSVADEETANLMVDFYKAVQSSNNPPRALADVQRKWMLRLRAERGLQAAIAIAGPFIMSSQGPVR